MTDVAAHDFRFKLGSREFESFVFGASDTDVALSALTIRESLGQRVAISRPALALLRDVLAHNAKKGLGFRIQGVGFRVSDLGLRV